MAEEATNIFKNSFDNIVAGVQPETQPAQPAETEKTAEYEVPATTIWNNDHVQPVAEAKTEAPANPWANAQTNTTASEGSWPTIGDTKSTVEPVKSEAPAQVWLGKPAETKSEAPAQAWSGKPAETKSEAPAQAWSGKPAETKNPVKTESSVQSWSEKPAKAKSPVKTESNTKPVKPVSPAKSEPKKIEAVKPEAKPAPKAKPKTKTKNNDSSQFVVPVEIPDKYLALFTEKELKQIRKDLHDSVMTGFIEEVTKKMEGDLL